MEVSPLVLEIELATAHLRAAGWPADRLAVSYEVTTGVIRIRITAGCDLREDATVFEAQLQHDGTVEARWLPFPIVQPSK